MVKVTRKLYPYSIRFFTEGEAGYDADGNWQATEGDGEWGDPVQCDAVPRGDQPIERAFEDGSVPEYTWLIILPQGAVSGVTKGQRCELTRLGSTQQYTVKGVMSYMFRIHLAI